MTLPEQIVELGGLRVVSVGDADAASMVVVLLHGFGMTPSDLSPFAHSLALPAWFLFPEGPLEAAIGGRAWWHIDAQLRERALARGARDFVEEHPPDLPAASIRLTALLDAVLERAGDRPVILGGFSQGGMLTCHTLLHTPRKVAGVALLSASRVSYSNWGSPLRLGRMCDVPILISHGEMDADLAFSAGIALRDCLTDAGADVTWVPFSGGHEIPLVVWRRLRKFALSLAPTR